MPLYERLKNKDLVSSRKEFQELVINRQIEIDNQRVIDPKLDLDSDRQYLVKIGILEVVI